MTFKKFIKENDQLISFALDQVESAFVFLKQDLSIIGMNKSALRFFPEGLSNEGISYLEVFTDLKKDEIHQFLSDVSKSDLEIITPSKNLDRGINHLFQKASEGLLVRLSETSPASRVEKEISLGNLFEKMPEGVIFQDASGKIIRTNAAAEQILGLSSDQLQGMTSIDPSWHAIHPDGSEFPGNTHPAMITLKTGESLNNVIMGVFNSTLNKYIWISINTIPEFEEGKINPSRVISTFTNITDQIEVELKLKEQSKLLELLVTTSTSFINVPEEKLKSNIQISLNKLGEFVNADRMYVFDYDWDLNTCSNTFEWCAPGITPQIDLLKETSLEGLEDWTSHHLKGELMYVEDVFGLPEDSALRQILAPQGIKSLLAMPICNQKECLGFIGLDSVKKHHQYSDNEIDLLKIFTGILVNVHDRLKSERELRERIKEFNTVYQVTRLAIQSNLSEENILREVAELVHLGFFEPEETSTRITFNDRVYESSSFKPSKKSINEKIIINGQIKGELEIFISEKNHFLQEEFTLVQAITNILGQHFEAKTNLQESQKNEQQLKNLLNSQTSFVLKTDLQGNHIYWNEKFREEFGWIYGDSGLVGGNALQSICEYHHNRTVEVIRNCLEFPGKIFPVELDKPGRNGSVITTLWEFVAITDEKGTPIGIQCIGFNISDRKKAENQLIESEEKYRFLFEESPDGNLVIKDGMFIDCNKSALALLRREKHELIGKRPHEISPERQPNGRLSKEYSIELLESTEKLGFGQFEWVHSRKDGSEVLVEIKLSKISMNGEEVIFTTWKDITEKRATEKALIRSEERFRQISEHTGSVIWELDPSGLYTYLGPASKRVFGYDPEELIGKKYVWELFPEAQREELKKGTLNLLNNGLELFDRETQILKKDGESIWVSSFGSPILGAQGEVIGYRGADYDITARKTAENELQKFRIISEKASYGTVITEFGTRKITYCNEAFAKMHGYEVGELMGKEIFTLHTEEQLDFYFKNVYPEYEKNKEYSIKEFGRKRKDGSTFPSLVTAKLFFDEEGTPLFNAATVIDLTNEKIIEEQIREQNLRLKAIIDAIPDLLYIMDKDGNYLEYFSSDKENNILDYGDLVGKNLREVFPALPAKNHLEKIRQAIRENKIQTYEESGPFGFENNFYESRIVPITSTKVLRFVREITQRKKDESEIRKLTLAIEQSPVAIIITDLKGNLEYMSPAFLQMTGYSHEELFQKPIGMIKSGLNDPKIYESLWNAISSGKNWQTEWRNRRKSGEIFWENISIAPIHDENGAIKNYLAVKQDITERKNYEEEIIQLNLNLEKRIQERTKELENSNLELEIARNEADSANVAKSEFLSRMSHELRTPMNSILGFAQLLQFTNLTESQSKNVEYILKSGNHLLQLINEVLDIAKIESGKLRVSLEPVELLGVIQEVADSVMPFATNNSVLIHLPSEKIQKTSAIADLQRLKQILINLLNNAIKYNRNDGSVWVRMEPFIEPEGKKFIRIIVEDNGIGISEENIPKLFKPFERVANDHISIEGTGLGLAVVEKLTHLMRGKVGVESKLGKGSKFWIDLPATEASPNEIRGNFEHGFDENHDQTTKGILLLIEDNISNIELIKELLRSLKPEIQVIHTMYGMEAIQVAKEYKPSLILLDLNLPDTPGAKVLERLRSDPETKELPIAVVSADATTKQMEFILSKGADQYITKPINVRHLIKIFDQYLKNTSHE